MSDRLVETGYGIAAVALIVAVVSMILAIWWQGRVDRADEARHVEVVVE